MLGDPRVSIDHFGTTCGYLGVAFGALLEGETALLLGGLAAFHGVLQAEGVMVAGFVGGIAGDQIYFHLGRRRGPRLLARKPRWQSLVARVTERLDRQRDLFIFSFRFLWGLRVVSPLLIGLTDVSATRYTVINVIGGVVWAVSITMLVMLLGQGAEVLVTNFHQLQLLLLAVGAVATGAWWLLRRRRTAAASPHVKLIREPDVGQRDDPCA